MRDNKLNFYFFGEVGKYDKYNPSYTLSMDWAPEILYIIAVNKPNSISKYEIINSLKINEKDFNNVIKNLKLINAIEVNNNKYKIKFPVFLKEDVIKMKEYLIGLGKIIGDKIISLRYSIRDMLLNLECVKNFSEERILYHIVCDKIFDDIAFGFFEERKLFCTSKIQPGNRNYIIVAYEDNEEIEIYSNKLLCSSNNYKTTNVTFNSFGDSNGYRKDMYRFFNLMEKNAVRGTPFEKLNLDYINILNNMNKEIARNCGILVSNIIKRNIKYNHLTNKEKALIKFLEELQYVNINNLDNSIKIKVPVFYKNDQIIIKEIANLILSNIFSIVKESFKNLKDNQVDLTSIKHGVNIKEVGNELWHQIFGFTSEYLAKEGFIISPNNIKGEGRYERSIILEDY